MGSEEVRACVDDWETGGPPSDGLQASALPPCESLFP